MKMKFNPLAFSRSPKFYLPLVIVAAVALLPVAHGDAFTLRIITLIGIYVIYSSGWNLLTYSGQASLGHAAFFGIGAYSSTLLALDFGISPWIGMITGAVVAAGLGLLVGLTCVRLKEWFLAMVTFGFAIILQTLTNEFQGVTFGTSGFPPPRLFSSAIQYYYAILVLAVISVVVIFILMRSKIGLAFKAVGENETEAKMMGVNSTRYKLLAFMVSTFFAGLAGAFFGHYVTFLSSGIYDVDYSFMPLIICILGGLGTIEGPIIGSTLIVLLQETLSGFDTSLNNLFGSFFPAVSNVGPPIRLLFLGLLLLVVVIFLPKGISSLIHKIAQRVVKSKSASSGTKSRMALEKAE